MPENEVLYAPPQDNRSYTLCRTEKGQKDQYLMVSEHGSHLNRSWFAFIYVFDDPDANVTNARCLHYQFYLQEDGLTDATLIETGRDTQHLTFPCAPEMVMDMAVAQLWYTLRQG